MGNVPGLLVFVRSICHGRRLRFQGSAHHVGARQGISDMGGVVDLKTNGSSRSDFGRRTQRPGLTVEPAQQGAGPFGPGFLPQGRRIEG